VGAAVKNFMKSIRVKSQGEGQLSGQANGIVDKTCLKRFVG